MIDKLVDKKALIINLDAKNKNDALSQIAAHLAKNGFVDNEQIFLNALKEREGQFSTGIGDEIAIPHAQNKSVLKNVVLIAKLKTPIDWQSLDNQKVKYIFSIALNDKDKTMQTDVLASLSKAIMNPATKNNLVAAKTDSDLLSALVIKDETKQALVNGTKNILAITACPTGIAHTYMASEKLEEVAKNLNYNIKVETQGRKIDNRLTQEEIDKADAIILAIDKGIDGMERFDGKLVLKVGVKEAIHDPEGLIAKALAKKGEIIHAKKSSETSGGSDYDWKTFKNVYKNLMGGVSRMLPFVVAGGILLGIAFLIDSGNSGGNLGATRHAAGWFAALGKVAFGAFVPVLGAYVAYSIVGAEGLMPGMVAGFIASGGGLLYSTGAGQGWDDMWGRLTPGVDQSVLQAGSGFLGAMFGGYLAAASVVIARKYIFLKVNKQFRGVVDIVAMPVLTILLTGLAMFVIQIPIAYFSWGLKKGMTIMKDKHVLVIVTIILATMMAIDMGGPINKVAYILGTSGLASGAETDYIIMGAVMAGGMVPPLAIAFSTAMFRQKAYSVADIESGKSNWLLGLFFITEGAIPFAAKDPKRVIPCLMLASAIVGAFIGAFQIGVSAPHGGIIVIALFKSYIFGSESLQIGLGITFLFLALIVGAVIGGFTLGYWKSRAVKVGKLKLAF